MMAFPPTRDPSVGNRIPGLPLLEVHNQDSLVKSSLRLSRCEPHFTSQVALLQTNQRQAITSRVVRVRVDQACVGLGSPFLQKDLL